MQPARSSKPHRAENRRAGRLGRFLIPIMSAACTLGLRSSNRPGSWKSLSSLQSSDREVKHHQTERGGPAAGNRTFQPQASAPGITPAPKGACRLHAHLRFRYGEGFRASAHSFPFFAAKVYHATGVRAGSFCNKTHWAIWGELCRNSRLEMVNRPHRVQCVATILQGTIESPVVILPLSIAITRQPARWPDSEGTTENRGLNQESETNE